MEETARRMLRLGVVLLLIGLLTGLVVPALAIPRLGVAAHIVGVLGGLALLVLGLLWPRLRLSPRASSIGFALAAYAFYLGWLMPLLGGAWGAGGGMLPIAAGGVRGSGLQEGVIAAGLGTSAVAIIALCVLLLWGLRSPARSVS
jgi:hydroxylaminobenzene mutase